MGITALILLFFLGVLLSFVGGIIGVVDAFRVSTVWGLLALLVPFALLVFCIKFWRERKWARNSLLMSLLGLLAMVLPVSLLGGIGFLTARNAVDEGVADFEVEIESIPAEQDDNEPTAGADGGGEGADQTAEGEGEDELFEEAMLPGLPTAAEIARAELLPSTDPNERIKEIQQERADPYAYVPVAPPPRQAPPAPANTPGNQGGNGAGQANGGNQPNVGGNAPNNGGAPAIPGPQQPGTTTPGTTAPGTQQPGNGPLPDLPPPTVVASQVQISGIASVDGETYAIVKAPNEDTSRYVRVGDRLSNGAVLVKRIENRPGNTPVVILEERGEEIALPVGANQNAPEEETAAASPRPSERIASLPLLP